MADVKATKREPGHYWCYGGDLTGWEVAFWSGHEWTMTCVPYGVQDDRWQAIADDPLPEPPPLRTIDGEMLRPSRRLPAADLARTPDKEPAHGE